MHEQLHRLAETMLTKWFSIWVKPSVLPTQPSQLIDQHTPVLYVLETGGLADRMALHIACVQHQLPLPSKPLIYGGCQESSSVDILKRRRGLLFKRHRLVSSKRLQRLMNESTRGKAHELQIVPVAVYWGRAPEQEMSIWDIPFSENWQIAGRTRKFFTTLLHGRDTLLSFSEPLSVLKLLESHDSAAPSNTPANTGTDSSLTHNADALMLHRKLGRILRVHFRQRRIASLGPDQSHRRMLIHQVIADPDVQQTISLTADNNPSKMERVERRANKMAYEIAADVSYPTVRILHRLMTRLWTELYDGVELHGMQRLQSVVDGNEVVYVPCHRSHIDYLLLSYILYINGYSLPHIAAGINLNLPIVGGLLRRGGAFFLRRSFAGDKLYATVFNAYLKLILQRGHSIEYFIEGGRSRTGRLLPPKGGMLAMTSHAYIRNPRTPVVFVPVYFGYERLLEGRSFISELSGEKKQKESLFGLLKTVRSLRENYGQVYVNFGTPIKLNDLLNKHQSGWHEQDIGPERPAWLTPVIDELGNSIMTNINQAACITPMSLLATALLATPRGHIGAHDLLQQMQIYYQLFQASKQNNQVVVPPIELNTVIAHGEKLGFIQVTEDPLGQRVSVKAGQHASITYFRNNIQHLLTLPSLIACCFTSHSKQNKSNMLKLVNYAYPFIQNELFLTSNTPESLLDSTLDILCECGILTHNEQVYHRATAGSTEAIALRRLSEACMPALERYFLCAALLSQVTNAGIETQELARRCQACAERVALTHGREALDLYDRHLHQSLIKTLLTLGYVIEHKPNTVPLTEGDNQEPSTQQPTQQWLKPTQRFLSIESEAMQMLTEQMRHAIINTTLSFSDSLPKTHFVEQNSI